MTITQPVNGTAAYPAGMTQTHPALSEANCSVNGFFSVEGFARDFQATGRGKTPQEAAANLKATIDETRAAFAPPAPVVPLSREAQVAALMAKGIACAVAKQDLGLVERIGKAAFLVLSNAVEPSNAQNVVAVRSQANPETWYEVTNDIVCTCPDWSRHHSKVGNERYLCKHALSSIMSRRLGEAP